MKLNKVLSIALSGVLAVGLLAGCAGSKNYSNDFADAFNANASLTGITFKNNDTTLINAGYDIAKSMDKDTVIADGYDATVTAEVTTGSNGYVAWPNADGSLKNPEGEAGKTTKYVAAFTYDADSASYKTKEQVSAAVADELTITVEANNTYAGYVAAYKESVTSDSDAWVVLVEVVVTVPAAD